MNDASVFAQVLAAEGDFEARCFNGGPPRTFRGDDVERVVLEALTLRDTHDVYVTLNPAANATGSVTDPDIQRIRWLPIDIDPRREGRSQKEPATEEERKAAADLATKIVAQLAMRGWGPPALHLDSGNGRWLLYRIDLENTPENVVLVRDALARLKALHPLVDSSIYNPSRICRVPGSVNHKGGGDSEAKIIGQSANAKVVTAEKLSALAGQTEQTAGRNTAADSVLEALEEQHGIGARHARAKTIGGKPCRVIELTDCPFTPQDTHESAACLYAFENGDLGFVCQGGRCKEAGRNVNDLYDLLNMQRRAEPDPQEPSRLRWVRASKIVTEKVEFLWGKRLVVGHLNLLMGNEKVGKGVLECRLAAMATTGELTGTPMNVAISSTEDRWGVTLKPRLEAAGADLDRVFSLTGLTLPDQTPHLAEGIRTNEIGLVFIDPIHSHFADGRNYAQSKDVNFVLNGLSDMADETQTTVVALIHTNRTGGTVARNRLAHSIEYSRVARSTVFVGHAPDGSPNERLIGHTMPNYSAEEPVINAAIEGVSVGIGEGPVQDFDLYPAMTLDGPSDYTVGEILNVDNDSEDRQKQREQALKKWEECAKEIEGIRRRAGNPKVMAAANFQPLRKQYGADALTRAKRHLGVLTAKPDGVWSWSFPPPK